MTAMIDATPATMPTSVSVDRSLLARIEPGRHPQSVKRLHVLGLPGYS